MMQNANRMLLAFISLGVHLGMSQLILVKRMACPSDPWQQNDYLHEQRNNHTGIAHCANAIPGRGKVSRGKAGRG